MLQKEAVDKTVLDLLFALQEKDYLKDFFLVGGTGLALMIGHRKSNDIDLFTPLDFDVEELLEKIESDFTFHMDFVEKNTIRGSADGVKVDFLAHKYPMINEIQNIEGLRIASTDDIAAMKVNSISNDGTRVKDFIDIYFLMCEHGYHVKRLLKDYEQKYTHRNILHALKSLNYFKDVNVADWPEMIIKKETGWDEMRSEIDRACKDYIRTIM